MSCCLKSKVFESLPDTMTAPLLTPLIVGLLIALAEAAQQDSSIVNGWEAKPHSRPYMVSVQQNNEHICGGFLVSNSFIMTAAHCWNKGERLTVLLGAHDINKKHEGKRAEVEMYYKHPHFSQILENDIMLLQLKTAVRKTKEVQWIPLPEKDEDVKPGTICSVAGWGALKTNGSPSPRLQEVEVTVVDRKMCRQMWRKTPITPRMMCAGGTNNTGFCQGDSGGPLVYHGQAVGIVSFNSYCYYPSVPNVYTQISKFLPWIRKYIKKN